MPEKGPEPATGLIGLGLVGRAIGERLMSHGRAVLGYDIAEAAVAGFREAGGRVAAGAEAVFAQCRVVLLSLPSNREVGEVLGAARGCLRRGQIILDTSTGDPRSAAAVAAELKEREVHYLDAPLSGSSEQVRRGEALWMVGGSVDAFRECEPLLQILAQKTIHTGPSGSASMMKLVTNLVLGLNRAALAEGLAFAKAAGLPAEQTLTILRESMAYSRIMDTKGEKMVRGDFTPQARLSQHLKDVRLMIEAAGRAGQRLPLTEAHGALLEAAEAAGLGGLDNSAILRAIQAQKAPANEHQEQA